ncbi:hypothetical protein L2E82_04549 [Cichorium intybus]|uniref:Uncharacterized protein n=1 Tax=Cichorium intybus TaxID=13427 RepID=A0ACB9H580_CICIN|nr:hypothetical protein L2E82_04549 [Cichorium intybus]
MPLIFSAVALLAQELIIEHFTPFGFQNEDRTLWEATDTYIKMSPFMAANKIKKPILLIHGEEDNNSGTLTMQIMGIDGI